MFPRKAGQHKNGDSEKKELKDLEKIVRHVHHAHPIKNKVTLEDAFTEIKKDDMPEGEEAAYRRLREARSEARLVGVREKRAKAKSDEAAAAKK